MNIKSKLAKTDREFALILLMFFLLTSAVLVRAVFHLIDVTKNDIKGDLELEATRLERSLTDKIDHTFSIIKNINMQISVDSKNKQHINNILRRYYSYPYLAETFSWTVFSWTDPNYRIIVDGTYGIVDKPVDLSTRDYVPATEKEPGVFQLGTPVLGAISKKWLIPGGVGIVDNKGKYLGATIVGFEIENLAKTLHKVLQNPRIDFKLFGKNEIEILHGNKRTYGVNKSTDDAIYNQELGKVLNQINSSKSDSISSISLLVRKHAFLAKKVANYPYILFLKYDNSGINNALFNVIIYHTIEVLFIIAGLSFLLFLIYREKSRIKRIMALKRSLKKADAVKVEFLRQSVQEFKNFILGIQGCAEVIENDLNAMVTNLKKEENPQLKKQISELEHNLEMSSQIIESSRELNRFINDLATTGKTSNGKNKNA